MWPVGVEPTCSDPHSDGLTTILWPQYLLWDLNPTSLAWEASILTFRLRRHKRSQRDLNPASLAWKASVLPFRLWDHSTHIRTRTWIYRFVAGYSIHWTIRACYEASYLIPLFSIHALICALASVSTTMIWSMVTLKMAASTTRLSSVGIATPFCHLYTACGVAKPKISARSLTDNPAFFLSLIIFIPVAAILIVGIAIISSPFRSCRHSFFCRDPLYKHLFSGSAPHGVRTHNLPVKSRLLYQLS